MRLERIIRYIKTNFRYIVLSAVLGGVIGLLVFYFFPFDYKATGSLFVSREPDLIQREEFTYEGYYAQRTADSYTETVIGILESDSLHKKVLQSLGTPVNENSLRSLRKNITVRSKAPQLVYLQVESKDKDEAQIVWETISDELVQVSQDLNRVEGDPKLFVQPVTEPVITETYKDLVLFTAVGVLVGAFISTGVFFGKSQVL